MSKPTFIKPIYMLRGKTRTPLPCDEIHIQFNPEKRLQIKPHQEEDTVIFRAECMNEKDEMIQDRYAHLTIDLSCSYAIDLTTHAHETRGGERLNIIPRIGYPKACSLVENIKNRLEGDKIIIQLENKSEVLIEWCQSLDTIYISSACMNEHGERSSHQFARLDLHPGACNLFRLKTIIVTTTADQA